ncbi:MAG: hypothetical protein AAF945_08980 [Actinomycetota bacterium]
MSVIHPQQSARRPGLRWPYLTHPERPGCVLRTAWAAAATLALVACGRADTADAPDPPTLTVVASDIAFDAAEYEVPAGVISVALIQGGELPHSLAFEDGAGTVVELPVRVNTDTPDSTTSITIEAGTYVLFCPIPGHRALGQEATLNVQ